MKTHTHTYILNQGYRSPFIILIGKLFELLARQANLFIHPPLPSYFDPLTVTIASQRVKSTNCSKQYNRIEMRVQGLGPAL